MDSVPEPVRRVIIAGGGTAGWMVATGLSKCLGKQIDIRLVESEEIGTVGVGEATIPTLHLLHEVLDLDESEFVQATQATFKLGISFENWRNVGENYFHSFGKTGKGHWTAGFHHFWLEARKRGLASDYGDYCLELRAPWRTASRCCPTTASTSLTTSTRPFMASTCGVMPNASAFSASRARSSRSTPPKAVATSSASPLTTAR
jgi:hypothetical protein